MKKHILTGVIATTLASGAIASTNSPHIDVLTGDTRTACEVILCLSSAQGKGISECKAPLRKYFSIRAKKWHKTLQKRRKFLDLCPAANENAKMSALTTAIQNQEYACDAATLNSRTEHKRRRVSDDEGRYRAFRHSYRTQSYLPSFCEDLYNHEFTEYNQVRRPKYVCNAEWYSKTDWERGYTQQIVSRKWNRHTDSYDYTYKQVPIKKDCWE